MISRICIKCGIDINDRHPNSVRCFNCQTEYRRIYSNTWKKRHHKRKPRTCVNCGKDITFRPNRTEWCEGCRVRYNQAYINKWKRDHRIKKTPLVRACSRCGKDISDRHYLAEICWDCRDFNKKRCERDYYQRNKTIMNATSRQYYRDNKERLIQYQMRREKFLIYKKNIKKSLENNIPKNI
jgi:hypothetical protein